MISCFAIPPHTSFDGFLELGFLTKHSISQHFDCSWGHCPEMQQQFHILGCSPSPALGRGVGVTSMSWAGAGFTSVQTQQCCVLKLLHHLLHAWFFLLWIQFITSVTEIKCQQKGASMSRALWPIQSAQCCFSDPPANTHHLSPKFLWRISCSSSTSISQGGSSWVSVLFNWVRFTGAVQCQINTTPLMPALGVCKSAEVTPKWIKMMMKV